LPPLGLLALATLSLATLATFANHALCNVQPRTLAFLDNAARGGATVCAPVFQDVAYTFDKRSVFVRVVGEADVYG
tara:strand:- start:1431 stop:1658 length:228 start_codon:yes stop_codon:yes gene_type:complete